MSDSQPRTLLQLTKAEEERLLNELKTNARAKCDPLVRGTFPPGRHASHSPC